MLQRIQTIWLLVAAVLGLCSLKTAFFIGSFATEPASQLTAMSNIRITIPTIAAATISLITIFLFKNRSLQLKLVMFNMVLSVLTIVLYFFEMKKYAVGGLALTCILVVAIPILEMLAVMAIYKDEALVKSVDRLR